MRYTIVFNPQTAKNIAREGFTKEKATPGKKEIQKIE